MAVTRPAIASPNDGFTGTTPRVLLALQVGLLQKSFNPLNAAQIRANDTTIPLNAAQMASGQGSEEGQAQALPPGSLLDPFRGQKASVIAQIKAKVAPFAPMIRKLDEAGEEYDALMKELNMLTNQFAKIDISNNTNSDLKALLTTKDRDQQYKVAQLVDKSAKTRLELAAANDLLKGVPPKLKSKETVEQGQPPKSLVVAKNKQVVEALLSPSDKVHPGILNTLQERVLNEVEKPLAATKKAIKQLEEKVAQQVLETKALAPQNAKQQIELNIRPGD